MTNTRTPSIHFVKVLDLSAEEDSMRAFLKRADAFKEGDRLSTRYRLGVVEVDGFHYLVDSDGCGSIEPIEDIGALIPWYKNGTYEDGTEYCGVYPISESDLNLREILDIPLLQVVRLDKFIRTFGYRLERNYEGWDRFLSLAKINRESATESTLELTHE